jgi:choline dehydrogenase
LDLDELARLAGDIASTIFHPVGTTQTGRADNPLAVVDSHLRVRGVVGLRVVDAGVMPSITSGNTNSPTLMLAEKAARWIVQGI